MWREPIWVRMSRPSAFVVYEVPTAPPSAVRYQEDVMGIIAWIFIGLIAGWLAKEILGGPGGIFYTNGLKD